MPYCRLAAFAAFLIFSTCLSAQFTYAGSRGNVTSPNLTHTEDGGGLILSTAYCYTPGSVVIEGCSYAQHLTRVNATGDTLWTSEIESSSLEGLRRVFENEDGGFTIFGSSARSFRCGNIFAGLYGWGRPFILRINNQGEEISRFVFNNECDLAYQDAVRLGDDRYVLVASYEDLFNEFPQNEIRYMIINAAGQIERQTVRNRRKLYTSNLLLNSNSELEFVFFISGTYVREVMDTSFTVISRDTSINLNDRPVFNPEIPKSFKRILSSDGTYHLVAEHRYRNTDTAVTHYLRFGPEMEILSEELLPLRLTTKLVEDGNRDIWIGADKLTGGGAGVRLHKLDRSTGTIQEIVEVELPELHVAKDFSFDFGAADILLVGEFQCCNLPDTIGPGEIFIFNNAPPTSVLTEAQEPRLPYRVFPNPTSRQLHLIPLTTIVAPVNYQLFDALGKRVAQGTATTEVDLGGLPSGMYTYVLDQNGEVIQSGKVVKR